MKEMGFKEYDEGWVFSKVYHPLNFSQCRDSWEMIITVTKNEFLNKATFDVINQDGIRVKYDDLMNDGVSSMKNVKLEGRGDLIARRFNEMAINLREEGIPFYMTGDQVIVEDKVETKVVCIDLDKPLMVGLSPKPKQGLASNGKINKHHTDNASVMFIGKGNVNTVWRSIFELRRVI